MEAPSAAPTRNQTSVVPLSSLAIKYHPFLIVSRYPEIMPDKAKFITVFRSADPTAEEDAAAAREQLAQEGIDAILLGDDAPGVVEGTWEVRVAPPDQERAEAVLAAPPPQQEDEDEVSEKGLS